MRLLENWMIMQVEYDLELIAKWNRIDLLNEGMKNRRITEYKLDSMGRSIVHQCCLFGNVSMLEYLTTRWGDEILRRKDKYGVSTTHGCKEWIFRDTQVS